MVSLLHALCNPRSARRGKAAPPRRQTSARPRLEALEDRLVPTVVFQPHFGPETIQAGSKNVGLKNPGVHLVFSGNYWADATGQTEMAKLTNAARSILNGPYLSGLRQYGSDGRATLVDSTLDAGGITSSPTTDGLSADLQRLIDGGRFDAPGTRRVTAGPIYVVVGPPAGASVNGFNALGTYAERNGSGLTEPMHEIWFNTVLQGNSVSLDRFTQAFSHELVETITNPGGSTGVLVKYPRGLPSSIVGTNAAGKPYTRGQIADFEPDQNYGYRVNGQMVQACWSDTDKAFVVPDGNAQKFILDPIWDANNNFTNTYQLTLRGDQLSYTSDDDIRIDNYSNDSGQTYGVRASMNGEVAQFEPGVIQNGPGGSPAISVNTASGNNTVIVKALAAGLTLNVDSTGPSSDVVHVGDDNRSLLGIAGTVNVSNSSGQTDLQIDDGWGRGDRFIDIEPGSISYADLAQINYSGGRSVGGAVRGVTSIEVSAGTGQNTVYAGPNLPALTRFSLDANADDTLFGPDWWRVSFDRTARDIIDYGGVSG